MSDKSTITVSIRFYAELNDFLRKSRRKTRFTRVYRHNTSLKDCIESCGVPHTEVGLILVNGISTDFDQLINGGDDISVYPVFQSLDISGVTRLMDRPLGDLRFVADVHLGALAKRLRLLGFDTEFANDASTEALLESVTGEKRVLLTRNRKLLMRRVVNRGLFIRANDPEEQCAEVIRRFHLTKSIKPFTRCMVCGSRLVPVSKEEVLPRLEPLTKKYFFDFSKCTGCGKVYWKGSHYGKLEAFLERVRTSRPHDPSPICFPRGT
jgi:uncharacterized protein